MASHLPFPALGVLEGCCDSECYHDQNADHSYHAEKGYKSLPPRASLSRASLSFFLMHIMGTAEYK